MAEQYTWFIPIKIDDWGFVYYGQSGGHGSGVQESRVLGFTEGQKVWMRWPDGKVEQKTIMVEYETHSVSDMGHHYNVTNAVPFFIAHVHGVRVRIELQCIELRSDHPSSIPEASPTDAVVRKPAKPVAARAAV